jgi:protein TonB
MIERHGSKKTPEADLENKRPLFFLMGFAVVLSAFYVLIEWKSEYPEYDSYPELLAPAFIENEYGADIENRQTVPAAVEPAKEEPPKHTVYEEYEVVEEVSLAKEETESIIQPIREKETILPDVDTEADVMPQFPGGNAELVKYIYSHIQYPSAALEQRIHGRVWCSFIVNRDGTVSDVTLEQGVYIFLDEEAVRVLKTMPPWIPGKTQGENVRVKIYLPVVFKSA